MRIRGELMGNSIYRRLAFAYFVKQTQPAFALVAAFDLKPGLFGVVRNAELTGDPVTSSS